MKKLNFFRNPNLLIFLSFILWAFCFKDFLSNELFFTSDAKSYYEHIKFFIDNIVKGIYPFWDPVWNDGVPNEFFLRRFGSFNPFFMIIVLFRKLGINYEFSYLYFLMIYYFLGAFGFYMLAKRIFNNKLIAFFSFLILLFSSLGTRLFDSYIVFEFVPMVWFFYFFTAFFIDYKRSQFAGASLCLMIILTTYIPFFFVVIFSVFLIFFVIFYPKETKECLTRLLLFARRNKLFIVLFSLFIVISLLPGLFLISEGKNGNFVLPARHSGASSKNVINVTYAANESWGILEDIFYSLAFPDLRRFKFAILYLPIFSYIILALGLFTKINRKLLFLAFTAISIFLISSPHFPVYKYFYKYIFFYKYFRNLHFFLWWALMPIFILFCAGLLKNILNYNLNDKKRKDLYILFISVSHLAIFLFLVYKWDVTLFSSYISVLLSFLFFLLHAFRNDRNKVWLYIILLSAVCAQPIEVYYHLQKNPYVFKRPKTYDRDISTFSFVTDKKINYVDSTEEIPVSKLYYAVKDYDVLRGNINYDAFNKYLVHKLIIYDKVVSLKQSDDAFEKIKDSFLNDLNVAYIPDGSKFEGFNNVSSNNSKPIFIEGNSDDFKVARFNSNMLRIETSFKAPKFLVYNDNFYPHWQAFLNDKKIEIYRSNFAFKGVFLPPGKNIVVFTYGTLKEKLLAFILLFIFYGTLVYFLIRVIIERKECPRLK